MTGTGSMMHQQDVAAAYDIARAQATATVYAAVLRTLSDHGIAADEIWTAVEPDDNALDHARVIVDAAFDDGGSLAPSCASEALQLVDAIDSAINRGAPMSDAIVACHVALKAKLRAGGAS